MGIADEIMKYCTFCQENYQGCSERYLRSIRDTYSWENNDNCDEVEEVVVYQGLTSGLKDK